MHQPEQELEEDAEFMTHDVEPRALTAQLPPILSKKVDEHSLSGIAFEQECIITACQEGKGHLVQRSLSKHTDIRRSRTNMGSTTRAGE